MESIGRVKTQQGGVWTVVYNLRAALETLSDDAEPDTEDKDNLLTAYRAMCRALDEVETAGYHLGCVPGEPE